MKRMITKLANAVAVSCHPNGNGFITNMIYKTTIKKVDNNKKNIRRCR